MRNQTRNFSEALLKLNPQLMESSSCKPPKRNNQFEYFEQCAFIRWAQLQYFNHVKNDGRSERLCLFDCLVISVNGAILSGNAEQRARQWAKLKASGARAGVADVQILYRTKQFGFAVIEMKRRRDQFTTDSQARAAVSNDQEAFLRTARSVGGYVAVAYGWIEAAQHVCDFMEWKRSARGV